MHYASGIFRRRALGTRHCRRRRRRRQLLLNLLVNLHLLELDQLARLEEGAIVDAARLQLRADRRQRLASRAQPLARVRLASAGRARLARARCRGSL